MAVTRELTLAEFESALNEAMARMRRRMEGTSPRPMVAWGYVLDAVTDEVLEERERCAVSSARPGGGSRGG